MSCKLLLSYKNQLNKMNLREDLKKTRFCDGVQQIVKIVLM